MHGDILIPGVMGLLKKHYTTALVTILSDSDDAVVSTTVATVDEDKSYPTYVCFACNIIVQKILS